MNLLKAIKTKIRVRKVNKPKFSMRGGRTWDCINIKVGNHIIKGWLDTTWGTYLYFNLEDSWYSIPLLEIEKIDPAWSQKWEIRLSY